MKFWRRWARVTTGSIRKASDLGRLLRGLQAVGAAALGLLETSGQVVLFALNGLACALRPPFQPRLLGRQLLDIGYYSLPVVGLTTLFTGMVLALQSHTGFARFSAEGAIPNIVVLSITRELAPVLTGLMIAGRVGASMAAELGAMRVSEQIDALETLSADPYRYLVAPRLVAGILMLPLLVLVGDVIGVFGGYLVGVYSLGFDGSVYIRNSWNFVQFQDVLSGLVKAAVFGLLVTLAGCYHGWRSRGGAQGVGAAATHAVVSASIAILISNYLLTQLFFTK